MFGYTSLCTEQSILKRLRGDSTRGGTGSDVIALRTKSNISSTFIPIFLRLLLLVFWLMWLVPVGTSDVAVPPCAAWLLAVASCFWRFMRVKFCEIKNTSQREFTQRGTTACAHKHNTYAPVWTSAASLASNGGGSPTYTFHQPDARNSGNRA